jgi:predicted dehydrogenase
VISELSEQVELVAVVDRELTKAEKLVAEHGGAPFSTLTEALEKVPEIDVVVVATPTGVHGEIAIEALDAGKHVIVEKPAETTVARTDRIIAARDRSGRLATVISQHRFDASTEAVLDAIRAGELGRVTSGVASIDWWRGQSYYDSGDWRGTWELDGGGALMNQGVHTLDLLIAALGRPVEVFAYTATLAHERIEVEDVAAGVVKFESGALGVLHASTAAYPGLTAHLRVFGDHGSAVIDDDRLTYFHRTPAGSERGESAYTDSDAANEASAGATGDGPAAGSDPSSLSDAHRLQYGNFLAALRGEEELRVTLEVNRQSIAVIEAVYASARSGRPVPLS